MSSPFYTGQQVMVTTIPGGEFATIVAINESPWVGGIQNISVRMADGNVREFCEGYIITAPDEVEDHDPFDNPETF